MIIVTILLRSKSDPQTFLIIACAFVIIGIFSYYFSRRLRVLRALRAEGVKRIKDFADGDKGKIIGNVVFAGETIFAPLSKRKCVFYHVIVEQYRSNGKHSGWYTIIEEEEKADVVISDGTGYAILDAENAMSYLVPDANYSSSSSETMSPELKQMMARHEIDCTGFFGFSKTLRCSEGILEKGELFAVAGEGQWNETKDHKLNLPSKNVLVIVPGPNENIFLSDDPEAREEPQEQQ